MEEPTLTSLIVGTISNHNKTARQIKFWQKMRKPFYASNRLSAQVL